MSLGKNRKKNRGADQRPKRGFSRSTANEQELVDESSNEASASAVESADAFSEIAPGEDAVESFEIIDSVAEFAPDDDRELFAGPAIEPDGSGHCHLMDDAPDPECVLPSTLDLELSSSDLEVD